MSQNESFHVSKGNIVDLLKKCAKLKDLQMGFVLHAETIKLGLLDEDIWIANSVIDSYSKCGSLAQAQLVLENLPIRNVVSWTSLVAGYANMGLPEEALKCFHTMQLEGIYPDRAILFSAFRACGSLKAVDRAEEVHRCCERLGLLEIDGNIGAMVVDIYATCGLLSRAQQVFERLPQKDTVTWTALITAYTQHNFSKEALNCFDQMQAEGVSPDAVTFIHGLKACLKLKAIDKVEHLHMQIERTGLLGEDGVVGTVLVDTFAKCGALERSVEVFAQLKHRDVISWTALIEGYAEHGNGEEALQCLVQMQLEGVFPNHVTFACILKACGRIGALMEGMKIHCHIQGQGLLENNSVVGNVLVDMYIKCSHPAKAHDVFDKLPVRNVIPWTSLIAGYAQHGHGDMALNCFEHMQLEGVTPNAVTFSFCLKACADIRDAGSGEELLAQIERVGLLKGDAVLGHMLVDMYAACGLFAKALQVFDKLPDQSVVSWTSLIARFAEHEYTSRALNCFIQMQCKGVQPNDITFVTVLKLCGSIGAIDVVQDLHSEVERRGLINSDLVGNVLVFAYSKCGLLLQAHEVFKNLRVRDVVSWNSLLVGYTQLGDTEKALSTCNQMLKQGLRLGSITFTNILSSCNRQGVLYKLETYFENMSKDTGIFAAPEHLCSMLNMFCRLGHFDKAIPLVESCKDSSNTAMLHSFLGSCKYFYNMDLGRWAFDHMLKTTMRQRNILCSVANS